MTALRSVASARNCFARSALDPLEAPVRLKLDATACPERQSNGSRCKFTAGAAMNYYRLKRRLLKLLGMSSRSAVGRDVAVEVRGTQSNLCDQSPCVRSF